MYLVKTAFSISRKIFSYSLPSMEDICKNLGVDAVLFVNGFDDCANEQRKELEGRAAVVSGISLLYIAYGLCIYTGINQEITIMFSSLVNMYGKIIWYNSYKKVRELDMTNNNHIDEFTFTLFIHKIYLYIIQ